MIRNRIKFIKTCYYIGAVADLIATIPLVFPKAAQVMFGINTLNVGNDYLYVSRIGASLMIGWTVLLIWGSLKPIERKGILFLTIFPVVLCLFIASICAVTSGFITVKSMMPLWIFYAILIPLYGSAYYYVSMINKDSL
ncbi:MAG: hypothetical protein V1652_03985 [bacterium]